MWLTCLAANFVPKKTENAVDLTHDANIDAKYLPGCQVFFRKVRDVNRLVILPFKWSPRLVDQPDHSRLKKRYLVFTLDTQVHLQFKDKFSARICEDIFGLH